MRRSRRRSVPAALSLAGVLAALACGRTEPFADPSVPAELPPYSAPSVIYVADGSSGCPRTGTEADLAAQGSERVVVAELRLLDECSGAGGQWIIGRVTGSRRDTLFGGHGCYYLDVAPTAEAPPVFGVVWMTQTAALFQGPEGWCINSVDGEDPVASDVRVRVVALYDGSAAAFAAVERWSR